CRRFPFMLATSDLDDKLKCIEHQSQEVNVKLFSVCLAIALVSLSSAAVYSQTTPADAKQYNKEGVMFNYLPNWTLVDDSNGDAQQVTLSRSDSDAQIRVFIHRGRITSEKMPQARKAFIDSYIDSTAKQFIAMGAKPEQSPDTTRSEEH